MCEVRYLPWLMIASAGFCLRVGISSLSPVLEHIKLDLGLSAAHLGLLTTIPVVCMGLLSSIGLLLERVLDMKRAMLVALGILAAGLLLRLDVKSYGVLVVTAMMVGIADAIIRPLLSGFIKHTFDKSVSAPMSVYAGSMGIGSALAAFLTMPVSHHAHGNWSIGLAVWALPAALAFMIWLTWRSKVEHAPIAVRQEAMKSVGRLETACFALFFGVQAGVNYMSIAWLPSLYMIAGSTESAGAFWVGIFVAIQTVTSLFFHIILRALHLSHARAILLFGMLAVVGAAGLFYIAELSWLVPVALGVATGALFPLALLLPLDFSADRRQAMKLSGASQSGGYLIGGALPWLAGLAADGVGMRTGVVGLTLASAVVLMLICIRIAFLYREHGRGLGA